MIYLTKKNKKQQQQQIYPIYIQTKKKKRWNILLTKAILAHPSNMVSLYSFVL